MFGFENITNSDMKCFYEDIKTSSNGIYSHKIEIIFRNGYRKDSPELICKCRLRIGQGKLEWGAEKRKRVLYFRNFGGIKMTKEQDKDTRYSCIKQYFERKIEE